MANAPIRRPQPGSTFPEWLKVNAPAVYAQLLKVQHDTTLDFRDNHWAKKHPGQTGRVR